MSHKNDSIYVNYAISNLGDVVAYYLGFTPHFFAIIGNRAIEYDLNFRAPLPQDLSHEIDRTSKLSFRMSDADYEAIDYFILVCDVSYFKDENKKDPKNVLIGKSFDTKANGALNYHIDLPMETLLKKAYHIKIP